MISKITLGPSFETRPPGAPQDQVFPLAPTRPEAASAAVSKDGPQTTAALVCDGTKALREAGVDEPRHEARLLLQHATGRSRERLIAHPAEPVPAEEAEACRHFIRRRMEREPVAYILGRREFWSLEFRVSPAVLIPRPDSETLIEAALGLYPDAGAALRVLDLGTGSGCLLLALLSERPNATGTGFDISAAALDVARSNAAALGLSSRARFAQGDWADLADGLDGAPFDLVLANPPYIPDPECLSLDRDVRDHEPHLALFGGADGLDAYRAILEILNYVLVPRGIALFEIGAGQTEPVSTLAGQAGYAVTGLFRDLAGHPRALAMTGRPEGVDKKMVGMGAPKG